MGSSGPFKNPKYNELWRELFADCRDVEADWETGEFRIIGDTVPQELKFPKEKRNEQ